MVSNRLRWAVSLAAIALALVVGLSPLAAVARQVPVVAANGDPGDGDESDASSGGFGDPTDAEDGDPTDGNGRSSWSAEFATGSLVDGEAGDPGDGKEGGRFTGVRSAWIDSLHNLVQALWWVDAKR